MGLFHYTHTPPTKNQDNGKRFRKRAKRPTTMAIELVSIHVKKEVPYSNFFIRTQTQHACHSFNELLTKEEATFKGRQKRPP